MIRLLQTDKYLIFSRLNMRKMYRSIISFTKKAHIQDYSFILDHVGVL